MTERGMRMWIGVFVLVALVLLGWLVIVFGSYPTFFKNTNQYNVQFSDAQGVGPGSPVRRSGVRIGEVRDVVLDDNTGEVKVVMALDRRYTLRQSDEAVVTTGLLGGDASIDIVSKPPAEGGQVAAVNREPIPPGGEITGKRQATVSTVLSQASGVVPTAQETLNDIRKSVQRVEKVVPVFEATMREYQELASDLRKATPNLNQASEELRDLLKDARKAVPTVNRTAEDVQALSTAIREAVPDARKTLQDVGALSQEASKAMPSLTKTSDEIRELAAEARKTVSSFTRTANEMTALIQEARGIPTEPRKMPEKELPPPKPPGKEKDEPKPQLNHVLAQPDKAPPPPPAPPTERSVVQDTRKTLEEVSATARTWNKVGERLDVLIQGNQDKLTKIIDNLNEVLVRASETFNETNQRNLSEILRNSRAASTNFDSISRNLDVITTEGRTSVRRLNSALERADSVLKDFQGATNSQGGRIGSITKNLDESSEKLNSVLSDVQVIVRNAGQADGTINRLLTDPSLYNKLEEAVCNLPRMMARVERILKDFEVFADKVARHPELIGVGGAVRPSTGVKDGNGSGGHSTYYPPAGPK